MDATGQLKLIFDHVKKITLQRADQHEVGFNCYLTAQLGHLILLEEFDIKTDIVFGTVRSLILAMSSLVMEFSYDLSVQWLT